MVPPPYHHHRSQPRWYRDGTMTSDERVQLGWRVDRKEKEAFEAFVNETMGETPGRKGRALERAMKEYRDDGRDRLILRRLEQIGDALGIEKIKGKSGDPVPLADGSYETPQGKSPGDVEARQRAVINHLLDLAEDERLPIDDRGPFVTQKILRGKIEEVAGVKSRQTVKRYLRDITSKPMFKPHPDRAATWTVKT